METWGFQMEGGGGGGGGLWSACTKTGEWEGTGVWNNEAPLNSSRVERSPPPNLPPT